MTTRQQVWLDAWCAYTSAANSTRSAGATEWADICLSDFDKRFPEASKEKPKDESK